MSKSNLKSGLHSRNIFRERYDFELLNQNYPNLKEFVFVNEFESETIDFSNPKAVKALNTAILSTYFSIKNWDFPDGYLCPPIPGRTDYIHYLADLLAEFNQNTIPLGDGVIGLDIGIGANCIYPILGASIYEWQFVGTDIDENAIVSCEKIIKNNSSLIDKISLQQQTNSKYIFKNIILPEDKFTFTICNPPFHSSEDEAINSNIKKTNNLFSSKTMKPVMNFGGQNAELWTEGGELGFIMQMIYESAKYPLQVLWFTTLVSRKDNLNTIYKTLNKVQVTDIRTIEMNQGHKISRIVAWTFLTEKQKKGWKFE